ncbi:tripartite tricarboxylate transporter TctB family protein [Pseudochelatococcus sp. B33]
MRSKDYRDVLGGFALIMIGIGAVATVLATLRLGTATQMGPGMFPAALGALLAAFGALIMVPAMLRAGDMPHFEFRPFATVIVSMLAFALLVKPFGLAPAIVAVILISSRADGKLSPRRALALGLCLAGFCSLLFKYAIGLPIAFLRWPW